MTYSQHGEDDFLARLFWTPSRPAGFKRAGFYVDVGCNDPKIGNNTYFFYLLGWRGVCIDPHQAFGEVYMKERPEDVFVGCAIAEHDGDVTLHYGEHLTLSSLLPSERNPNQCKVPSRRLDTLFKTLGVPAEFDILSVDVEGYIAGGDQVVGDDPPVTPPPQSFRTHDRAALGVAQFAQLVEPNVKVLAHGVVGVVVKALVLPERVRGRRYVRLPSPQAAKSGHVHVSDIESGQKFGERGAVVLRIAA